MMLVTNSTVDAQVRYINADWKHKPEPPRIGSRETRRAVTSFQDIKVHDARPGLAAGEVSLDRSGFTLTRHNTAVNIFTDNQQIENQYYPEMTSLLREVTGADHAFVYSHLVRTETPVDFNDGYARFVHCDYNVRRLGEMSEELLAKYGVVSKPNWEYVWYNTWQPFDHQVQQNPLAVIDWQSLPADDVIDYVYTGRGRDSLVAAPIYNPKHRWCYFPLMETNEVLIMKQMDGRPNRAVYCPHTSFDDRSAEDDALPRRSIETRLMAVMEN